MNNRPVVLFLTTVLFFFSTLSAYNQKVINSEKIRKGIFKVPLKVHETSIYRLTAVNRTPVSLTLMEKLGGPVESDGEAGKSSGKIYRLLQEGDYYVLLKTSPEETEKPKLKLEYSSNPENQSPSIMPDNKVLMSELGDMEQKSWKIEIPEYRRVHIEAMGRSLGEVKIWQQGKWIIEADFVKSYRTPVSGRRMCHFELNTPLSPGTYTITLYGTEPQQWPETTRSNPLYIRTGSLYTGDAGTFNSVISPFGQDYFISGKAADTFELKFIKNRKAQLKVTELSNSPSWNRYFRAVKSVKDGWGKVKYKRYTPKLISVSGPPGAKYSLNLFKNRKSANLKEGKYWISTISSMKDRYSLPYGATLLDTKSNRHLKIHAQSTQNNRFTGKINLTKETATLIFIKQKGTYRINENSKFKGRAIYQLFPMAVKRNRKVKWVQGAKDLELTRGYFYLKIKPLTSGILNFSLNISGEKPDFSHPSTPGFPILWRNIEIKKKNRRNYFRVVGKRGIDSGLVIRKLPFDLIEPIWITLSPGEKSQIMFQTGFQSKLTIRGQEPEIFYQNGVLNKTEIFPKGIHKIDLFNRRGEPISFLLGIEKKYSPPKFKPLVLEISDKTVKVFADYNYGESRNISLKVKKPGFYKIETTGRLATELKIRTVSNPSLYKDKESGSGRNSLIMQYLKEGDYLIHLKSSPKSKGRAGLSVTPIPPFRRDLLEPGKKSRLTLPPTMAAEYHFKIEDPGEYILDTKALKAFPKSTLRDSEGWALTKPGIPMPFKIYLNRGNYSLFSLPLQVKSRRVTEIKKVKITPNVLKGKGPHTIELNKSYKALWLETEDKKRDIYKTILPADIEAELHLPSGIKATIYSSKGKKEAKFGKWEGILPEGEVQIEVSPIEKDNRRAYTISLNTKDLAPGISRKNVKSRMEIPVVVPENSHIEISSSGLTEVRGILQNLKGETLVKSKEIIDDWNFIIKKTLKKGRYRLLVTGRAKIDTEISMKSLKTRNLKEAKLPSRYPIPPGDFPVAIPFNTSQDTELVKIEGEKDCELLLYKGKRLIARSMHQIIIPLKPQTRYHLSLWKSRKKPLNLKFIELPLKKIQAKTRYIPFYKGGLKIVNKGGFTKLLKRNSSSLLYSPTMEAPCLKAGTTISSETGTGWLYGNPEPIQMDTPQLNDKEPKVLDIKNTPLYMKVIKDPESASFVELKTRNLPLSVTAASSPLKEEENLVPEGTISNNSSSIIPIPKGREFLLIARKADSTPQPVSENRYRESISIELKSFPLLLTEKNPKGIYRVPPNRCLLLNGSSYPSLEATLSKNLLLYSWKQGRPQTILSSTKKRRVPFDSPIYLLNSSSFEGIAQLKPSNEPFLPETSNILSSKKNFEKIMSSAGKLKFAIPENATIHIAGKDIRYRVWSKKGQIVDRGEVDGVMEKKNLKGTLEILHPPGPLKVWTNNRSFIEGIPKITEEFSELKEEPQLMKITRFSGLLYLRSPKPAKIELKKDGVTIKSIFINKNQIFRHYLKGHNYTITGQSLKGSSAIDFHLLEPEKIEESSPMQVQMVTASKPVVYKIEIPDLRNVGIGLKTSKDVGTLRLFSKNSDLLANSPLIIKKLKGEYLLTVETRNEPFLYHLIIRGTKNVKKVPAEVIQKYMKESVQ